MQKRPKLLAQIPDVRSGKIHLAIALGKVHAGLEMFAEEPVVYGVCRDERDHMRLLIRRSYGVQGSDLPPKCLPTIPAPSWSGGATSNPAFLAVYEPTQPDSLRAIGSSRRRRKLPCMRWVGGTRVRTLPGCQWSPAFLRRSGRGSALSGTRPEPSPSAARPSAN